MGHIAAADLPPVSPNTNLRRYDRKICASFTIADRIVREERDDRSNDTFPPVEVLVQIDLDTNRYVVTLSGPSNQRSIVGCEAKYRGDHWLDVDQCGSQLVVDAVVETARAHHMIAD